MSAVTRGRKPDTSFDAAIHDVLAAGGTVQDAANATGMAYGKVRRRTQALSLVRFREKPAPTVRAKFAEAVRSLAEAGLDRRQIAEKLSFNYTRVCFCVRRNGITISDRRGQHFLGTHDQSRADTMARRYAGGETLKQIGDDYNLTRERVRQILRSHTNVTASDGGASIKASRRREERATARDQAYMDKLGCGWDEYKRIRDLGRDLIKAGAAPCKAPLIAFLSQKRSAGQRGIGWHLSFWDWWTIWLESGRWAQRGRGQGYVMCRKADIGPYAVGNVFIATAIENTSSSKHNKSGLPVGVSFKLGAYYAHRMIGGKKRYLGRHRTAALAYAAYVAAAPPAPAIGLVFPTTQRPDA